MKIAVLSCTRDRLAYTQHCFQTLHDLAGCEFDHYVYDQASTDGTAEWIRDEYDPDFFMLGVENIGISAALNKLIDWAFENRDYDAVVKFDNDCELVTENTLADVCEVALQYPAVVSPHIHGLKQPPRPVTRFGRVSVTPVIGGIFMAVPATVFTEHGYRHDETNNPKWGGDDYNLCRWWQQRGGIVGYVDGYDAWHYETTDGQAARFPAYFARKEHEMAA